VIPSVLYSLPWVTTALSIGTFVRVTQALQELLNPRAIALSLILAVATSQTMFSPR
jgi:hypothetical protein